MVNTWMHLILLLLLIIATSVGRSNDSPLAVWSGIVCINSSWMAKYDGILNGLQLVVSNAEEFRESQYTCTPHAAHCQAGTLLYLCEWYEDDHPDLFPEGCITTAMASLTIGKYEKKKFQSGWRLSK
jgi:hypothetical protein